MRNFIYNNSTTIIFGKETEKSVDKYCKQYGKKFYFIMVVEALKRLDYMI